MKMNVTRELAALEEMTVGQLQQRHVEVFGELPRSRHKAYLIRRIAWRLQADAEGGLSERARERAAELANIADVRVTPPRARTDKFDLSVRVPTDGRLPPPGTLITRLYKGRNLTVTVLADGFEHMGERYGSLTAVAKAITGSHMNGYRFFGLEGKP